MPWTEPSGASSRTRARGDAAVLSCSSGAGSPVSPRSGFAYADATSGAVHWEHPSRREGTHDGLPAPIRSGDRDAMTTTALQPDREATPADAAPFRLIAAFAVYMHPARVDRALEARASVGRRGGSRDQARAVRRDGRAGRQQAGRGHHQPAAVRAVRPVSRTSRAAVEPAPPGGRHRRRQPGARGDPVRAGHRQHRRHRRAGQHRRRSDRASASSPSHDTGCRPVGAAS